MSVAERRLPSATAVAIIGAGPYGLSVAAHLRARGIEFRIFGDAMESWRSNMPAGMLLKSEGFASNLSAPNGRSTLAQYCRQQSLAYGETGVPIPLDTIIGYGMWFQREHAPNLEDRRVEVLDRSPGGFHLRLDDGETLVARQVVVAVGHGYFTHLPSELRHLPAGFLSHSGEHHDLRCFQGRHVTVIGGGASALELAALLKQINVDVLLVSRRPTLKFDAEDKAKARNVWHKVRYPLSGIGRGWRNCFFTGAPMAFRHLPQETRLRFIRPPYLSSGAWWTKDLIVGKVPALVGRTPTEAEMRGGRVSLRLRDTEGIRTEVETDHVIAATGFKTDVQRLRFLSAEIRASLRAVDGVPSISRYFESSVPGLHFVGVTSALDFGPVMRFIYGTDYAARRLSGNLARKVGQQRSLAH